MEELLAALIGVVTGAVATGAAQTWQQSRDRRLAGKVAARLLLGDLYIAEHTVDRIIEGGRWPDLNMPTFESELEVWADEPPRARGRRRRDGLDARSQRLPGSL